MIQTEFLIINSYSQSNIGDAAILNSTVDFLQNNFDCKIAISTRYFEEEHNFGANVKILPPVIRFPIAGKMSNFRRFAILFSDIAMVLFLVLLRKLNVDLTCKLAKLVKPQVHHFFCASNAIVIVSGGGYFYSTKRKLNLSFIHAALSMYLLSFFQDKIVTMPQSFGPIFKKSDRYFLNLALSRVSKVLTREEYSQEYLLQEFSIESILLPDIVFSTHKRITIPTNSLPLKIRIVVMDWTWARHTKSQDLEKYLNLISRLVDSLIESGFNVTLGGHSKLPEHNQDDFCLAQSIYDRSIRKPTIDFTNNLEDLYLAYANSDLVVSTRLHGAIMAISQGTPALALGYQPKSIGTFKLIGLEDYCMDVQNLDLGLLLSRIHFILENRNIITNDFEEIRSMNTKSLAKLMKEI